MRALTSIIVSLSISSTAFAANTLATSYDTLMVNHNSNNTFSIQACRQVNSETLCNKVGPKDSYTMAEMDAVRKSYKSFLLRQKLAPAVGATLVGGVCYYFFNLCPSIALAPAVGAWAAGTSGGSVALGAAAGLGVWVGVGALVITVVAVGNTVHQNSLDDLALLEGRRINLNRGLARKYVEFFMRGTPVNATPQQLLAYKVLELDKTLTRLVKVSDDFSANGELSQKP